MQSWLRGASISFTACQNCQNYCRITSQNSQKYRRVGENGRNAKVGDNLKEDKNEHPFSYPMERHLEGRLSDSWCFSHKAKCLTG